MTTGTRREEEEEEEEEEENNNDDETFKKTEFLAFTTSGKPVWSRFGDALKLSSLVGALSAICAVAEGEEECDETVREEEEGDDVDDEKEGFVEASSDRREKKQSERRRRSGQLHYVEKRTTKGGKKRTTTVLRLAVLRKGALRFAAVSKDPSDTEHAMRIKLEAISKAFTFLFGDAIEMNLRRSHHRFDPRKVFFREQEDVYLKSVAESLEGGDALFASARCGRKFRALSMREEKRAKVTAVLRSALEKCGDSSKTCFAVIYTESKGVVAYVSPKLRSRGVFEGFNANVVNDASSDLKRTHAEDVWYLMHHVRTVDRYKMNKKEQDRVTSRTSLAAAAAAAALGSAPAAVTPSSSPRKNNGHSRNPSLGEEIILAGGGIVVKPPPPPLPSPIISVTGAQVAALEKFKRSFCEEAYDMSICLPSGAEGSKFVLARTMKIRLNEDELVGKAVEYDDFKVKRKMDDETMYVSIVSKSEDAAARAHESMDELLGQMHSQSLLRDVFLASHERSNDIATTIAPALMSAIAYAPSLSDDDEEESESDAFLTEMAKNAIAKLEHFVYAKPELGQYQIADEEEEEEEEKERKRKRTLREYARMHAAAHFDSTNKTFHDEMLKDIEKNQENDEMLESVGSGGTGSASSLSPQSSSEFRAGGLFNFGGLNLNGSESNSLSPMASRIFSRLGRSASGTSDDANDDINAPKSSASENDEKSKTSPSEQEVVENRGDGATTTHRVRYESDQTGIRIGCFATDFELFCQFKPNTSCEDAVATTNRLAAHLKKRESDSFVFSS